MGFQIQIFREIKYASTVSSSNCLEMECSDIHPGLPVDPALASLLAHHQALERNPQEGPRGLNERCVAAEYRKLIESKTKTGSIIFRSLGINFLLPFPRLWDWITMDYMYNQNLQPKTWLWHMILGYNNDIREHLASDVAPTLLLLPFEDPPKRWIMMNQTLLHCLQHVQPFPPSITIPNSQKKDALFLWPAPYVTMILARLEIWQVLASSTYRDRGTTSQPGFPD